MNTSYHTLQDGMPWSQTGAFGTRKTFSITLDQIRWADWVDPKPALMFVANGAWGDSGTSIWYDNFRLIDTGDVSQTPALSGLVPDLVPPVFSVPPHSLMPHLVDESRLPPEEVQCLVEKSRAKKKGGERP